MVGNTKRKQSYGIARRTLKKICNLVAEYRSYWESILEEEKDDWNVYMYVIIRNKLHIVFHVKFDYNANRMIIRKNSIILHLCWFE